MEYEKIIKRENGDQFKIYIFIFIGNHSKLISIDYDINIFFKPKCKRKWLEMGKNLADCEYRFLSFCDYMGYNDINNIEFISEDEIYEAKLEMWELLKPKKGPL